ncbi:MAG TPA: hypothetical protein VIQ30_25190 [Pseudonocardia sp.]
MSWTVEAIIAVIAMPLAILAVLVGAMLLWRGANRDAYGTSGTLRGLSIGCLVVAVGLGVGFWWGMYPWQAEYHQWRPVSGVVATIDSRLLAAGKGSTEQKFVVSFVGDPVLYGVLDTRAASVRPGDRLDISCVRRWQQAGTDGYDCLFGSMTRAGTP